MFTVMNIYLNLNIYIVSDLLERYYNELFNSAVKGIWKYTEYIGGQI